MLRHFVDGSCFASHHNFLTCGHSARGSQGPAHACARSTFPHLEEESVSDLNLAKTRDRGGGCKEPGGSGSTTLLTHKAECWEQSCRSSRGSEPGGGCWGRALHSVRLTFVDAVSGGRAWGLGTRSLATSAGGHGREMISIFGLLLRERHQAITSSRGANSSGEQNNNRKRRECLSLAPSVRTFSTGNRLLQFPCPVLAPLQRHVPHHRAMKMHWRQTISRIRRAAGGWEGFLSLPRRSLPVSSRAGRH